MRKYPNEYKITKMHFEVPVVVFCPLGINYNKANLTIDFELGDTIVDFIDLENYFKVDMNGKALTSEQVVAEVWKMIKKEYNPISLRVELESNSHFTIKTIKEL